MEYNDQDAYNKRLLVETLKRGKKPKRAGLGTRLYHLAGFTDHIYCVLHRDVKDKKHLSVRLRYTKWAVFTRQNMDNLHSKEMHEIFTKYLGEYVISGRDNSYCVEVFFSPDVEINWGALDLALREKYPNNHTIDNKGFVHIKY